MKRLADDLYQLSGFPPNVINIYVMGGVLVDAGTRFAARRILRQVRGLGLSTHALTHAHPDHQGSSHVVCEALGLPLWCGAGDADAMETAGLIQARLPDHWLSRAVGGRLTGPPHPVARRLVEGDEVGGFSVLETPGHCAGHVSYWRASDRVLVIGDVLANINPLTGIPGLHEPPTFFSPDPARNRQSARRLAELEPSLICFGHGAPLRDTRKFLDFLAKLPT